MNGMRKRGNFSCPIVSEHHECRLKYLRMGGDYIIKMGGKGSKIDSISKLLCAMVVEKPDFSGTIT